MPSSRPVRLLVAALLCLCSSSVRAGIITLDLCPGGTTSNQNVFGTTLSGGVATWPARSNYRDYQFQLSTPSGTATFDEFSVLLSAQLRQSTAPTNTLRATLWSGVITANPLLSDALVEISVTNAVISSSGYSKKVTLSGASFAPQTITSTPSPFFFRVWAEGAGSNNGYQTKMAALSSEMQSITMNPDARIDGSIGVDSDDNGFIDGGNFYDPLSEVPELDPAGMGAVAALVAGALGLLERRRRASP